MARGAMDREGGDERLSRELPDKGPEAAAGPRAHPAPHALTHTARRSAGTQSSICWREGRGAQDSEGLLWDPPMDAGGQVLDRAHSRNIPPGVSPGRHPFPTAPSGTFPQKASAGSVTRGSFVPRAPEAPLPRSWFLALPLVNARHLQRTLQAGTALPRQPLVPRATPVWQCRSPTDPQ